MRNNFLERMEREQEKGSAHLLMDRYCVEKRAEERAIREAKQSRTETRVQTWATIAGFIIAMIGLLRQLYR